MTNDTARKKAEKYSEKYNNPFRPPIEDPWECEIEGPKYSCDGCDQNKKALYHAYLAGFEDGQKNLIEENTRLQTAPQEGATKPLK